MEVIILILLILMAISAVKSLNSNKKSNTFAGVNVEFESDDEDDDSFYERKDNNDNDNDNNLQYFDSQAETEEDTELKMKLLSYSDEHLQRIVSRPTLYKSGIVTTAKEILGRRKAWEQIKDLTDAELLELSMSDINIVEDDIVEAASMELYNRNSQLLYEEFTHLTQDAVISIADGTSPSPEGIHLAAQAYLNSINNH